MSLYEGTYKTPSVYFSGKITNSIVNYLVRNGSDSERFYELSEVPSEFLRDPTCWLDAKQVETFLGRIDREYGLNFSDGELLTNVGHSCHELRSWGVLDSVLRMMQSPQDLFNQPERILSYFISPAPPVANVARAAESVGFDLPISPEEYPFFSQYLKAALEGLPVYAGKSWAHVNWVNTRLEISWSEAQASFFEDKPEDVNLKPELIRTLIDNLERAQSELEERKRDLLLKDQEIKFLKESQEERVELGLNDHQQVMLENMRSQFYRLADYLGRAQQLVTLLVKQDRMDRQVQEAMKRVDWERIIESLPQLRLEMSECVENLHQEKKARGEKLKQSSPHDIPQTILDQ